VTMDTTSTLCRIKQQHTRAKRQTTIIAARDFCLGDNILRSIINSIGIERMRRWRRRSVRVVWATAERLVIRTCGCTATLPGCVAVAIVIGKGH